MYVSWVRFSLVFEERYAERGGLGTLRCYGYVVVSYWGEEFIYVLEQYCVLERGVFMWLRDIIVCQCPTVKGQTVYVISHDTSETLTEVCMSKCGRSTWN